MSEVTEQAFVVLEEAKDVAATKAQALIGISDELDASDVADHELVQRFGDTVGDFIEANADLIAAYQGALAATIANTDQIRSEVFGDLADQRDEAKEAAAEFLTRAEFAFNVGSLLGIEGTADDDTTDDDPVQQANKESVQMALGAFKLGVSALATVVQYVTQLERAHGELVGASEA